MYLYTVPDLGISVSPTWCLETVVLPPLPANLLHPLVLKVASLSLMKQMNRDSHLLVAHTEKCSEGGLTDFSADHSLEVSPDSSVDRCLVAQDWRSGARRERKRESL